MGNSEIVDQYLEWANLYVTGCYIVNERVETAEIYNTGTFSFIDTGTKKIGVTCEHVLKDYEEKVKNYSDVAFYIGNKKIDPYQRILDRSSKYDIVTFDFDSINLNEINDNLFFCSPSKWPVDRPDVDDTVIFAGYPGQFVKKGIPELELFSVRFAELVNSCSDDKFAITRDLNSSDVQQLGGSIDMSEFKRQGGLSGTLILKPVKQGGIETVLPIGILYEGTEFDDGKAQVSLVRYTDLIQKDGTIS